MNVQLNKFEEQIAKTMAKVRRKNAEFLEDTKIGGQSFWETELNGCGSELAAAKALNVYPDLRGPGLFLEDLTYDGYTIDVKVTKYKNGKLLAPLNKKNKSCDLYVLVIGQFPCYYVVGVATKEMLINKDSVIDVGHGPTYGLNQDQLIPLQEWIDKEYAFKGNK